MQADGLTTEGEQLRKEALHVDGAIRCAAGHTQDFRTQVRHPAHRAHDARHVASACHHPCDALTLLKLDNIPSLSTKRLLSAAVV
ncbi:hypothetical protein GCM10010336_74540 [Streptomyces goshikiensis]|nr:hypothetical protein GCM10010336_74540 [Streptomyces goshikiensis]